MKGIKKILLNDKYILLLVLVNAGVIFAQLFPYSPKWLGYCDAFFTVAFIVEATVKIRTWSFSGYWRGKWNRFDFILTLISVPSLFLMSDSSFSFNTLLALRVLRILRSLRLFKFIPNIQSMIAGVHRAIRSSSVIIVSFAVVLFAASVVSCAMFNSIAPEFFETPVKSLYSIFRLFTIEGWYEIPDAISANSTTTISVLSRLYFIALLFVGGIIGISIINSIFVDAMVADNNDELTHRVNAL